jgi:hypothetical protein
MTGTAEWSPERVTSPALRVALDQLGSPPEPFESWLAVSGGWTADRFDVAPAPVRVAVVERWLATHRPWFAALPWLAALALNRRSRYELPSTSRWVRTYEQRVWSPGRFWTPLGRPELPVDCVTGRLGDGASPRSWLLGPEWVADDVATLVAMANVPPARTAWGSPAVFEATVCARLVSYQVTPVAGVVDDLAAAILALAERWPGTVDELVVAARTVSGPTGT